MPIRGGGARTTDMKLLVEEEYGFKYWCWTIEGTQEEITAHFTKVIGEKEYPDIRNNLDGKWAEVEWDECRARDEYDGFAHVHQSDDSTLRWKKQ